MFDHYYLQLLDSLSGPVEQTAEYLYQRGATVAATLVAIPFAVSSPLAFAEPPVDPAGNPGPPPDNGVVAWFQGRSIQAKRELPLAASLEPPVEAPAKPERYQPEKPVAPAMPGVTNGKVDKAEAKSA